MAAAGNTAIRRNAYKWAAILDCLVAGRGDQQGSAAWCARKYIDSLVGLILRRKARVDTAVAAQMEKQKKMSDDVPLPLLEEMQPEPRLPQSTVEARLINAVSGEVYLTMQMSKWTVIGDAVHKANEEIYRRRKADSVFGPDGADDSHVGNWKFVPADERGSRCRFHAVLAAGQTMIDVPVFKTAR